MPLTETGSIESFQMPAGSPDWSDLGRLVRRAAVEAVATHFAELAEANELMPPRDVQVEPAIR